jgi:hypothetical protein
MEALIILLPFALIAYFVYSGVRQARQSAQETGAGDSGADFSCSVCGAELEEIGVPPDILALQSLQRSGGRVVNIGGTVPQAIKDDPFLYRGFFCGTCRKAFCPSCSNMQGEVCVSCGSPGLMPAYRPLLRSLRS